MPVDTVAASFSAMRSKWERVRDVLGGSDAVKAKRTTYLPMLGGQRSDEYAAYIARALFFGATERTHAALTGLVFRKDAAVNLPAGATNAVASHLQDITLDGLPANDFAAGVLREVIGVGRAGVLVDMASEDTPEAERRPYWVLYEAEQIINWRVVRVGSDYVTSLVVLKETVAASVAADPFQSESKDRYRVLALEEVDGQVVYTVTVHVKGRDGVLLAGDRIVPKRRGVPLDFIPFVPVNPSSVRFDLEAPPLLPMADVNLSHYRTSADLEHGRHFAGLPTAWAIGLKGEGDVPLGPNVVLKLEGANAAVGMLEFKGEGLKTLERALSEKQQMMDVLGGRLTDRAKAKAETAESVKSRNAAADATLRTIANTCSLALTMALRWHVWWAGFDVPDAGVSIELNREFYDSAEPSIGGQQ